MDLSKAYKETMEALEKERALIASEKKRIEDKDAELKVRELELLENIKDLKKAQNDLRGVKDILQVKEENKAKEQELHDKDITLKAEEIKLKKYENTLVEMSQGLKDKEAILIKREGEQSEREKTYKEKIRKEFYEELEKRMPR